MSVKLGGFSESGFVAKPTKTTVSSIQQQGQKRAENIQVANQQKIAQLKAQIGNPGAPAADNFLKMGQVAEKSVVAFTPSRGQQSVKNELSERLYPSKSAKKEGASDLFGIVPNPGNALSSLFGNEQTVDYNARLALVNGNNNPFVETAS